MRRFVTTFALILGAGCGAVAPVEPLLSVRPGDSFTLRVGEESLVKGASLRLRFDGVPVDSRCPITVTCVWEGDAQVAIVVTEGNATRTSLDLHTRLLPRSVVVGGFQLELETLLPAPESELPIPQERYAATFRVTHHPEP